MKNTKQVTGRRELRFDSFDDVLADAEQVTFQPHHTLGNWTAAENLDHMAIPIEWATDGYPAGMSAPLFFKVVGPMLKGRFLKKGFPAGIEPPPTMAGFGTPRENISLEDAMQRLRTAIERFKANGTIEKNLLVGRMSKPQWEQFNCRHCELHLSFIVPGDSVKA